MHRLGRLVPPTLLSSSPVEGSIWSSGLQHIVRRHEKTSVILPQKKKKYISQTRFFVTLTYIVPAAVFREGKL